MTALKFLIISSCFLIAKVSCENYDKFCYINFMLTRDLLDRSFQIFNHGEKVDDKCEQAVNSTISKIRSSSNDVCVADFLRKKHVSETLLKEYLLPQFRSSQNEVEFDDRFTIFKNKAVNISLVICNNNDVFRPDLRAMMKNGRLQKESKSKEIECLQHHIMIKNKPLSDECKKIVDGIKDEFYNSTGSDMRRVFAAPNDNLVNLKCSEDKAKHIQMFEKVFFFVVLAATKNMNDKQIDVLLQSANGVIWSSTRLIFECML